MTELVQYSKDDFSRIKGLIQIPQEIKDKYEQLFADHECFQHASFLIPFKFQKDKKNIGLKQLDSRDNKKRQIFHKIQRRPLATDIGDKHFSKRVKGLLNIINDTNYEKQINKLIFTIEHDNVDAIISIVMSTSVLQVFYIGIFIRILNDISKTSYKHNVKNEIDMFIHNFFANKEMYLSTIDTTTSDYDIFCFKQKHKVLTVSKAIVILHLIKHDLTTFTLQQFVENITNDIDNALNMPDDHTFDIILQILLEAKKIMDWKPPLGIFEVSKPKTLSKKIEFMCAQLLA